MTTQIWMPVVIMAVCLFGTAHNLSVSPHRLDKMRLELSNNKALQMVMLSLSKSEQDPKTFEAAISMLLSFLDEYVTVSGGATAELETDETDDQDNLELQQRKEMASPELVAAFDIMDKRDLGAKSAESAILTIYGKLVDLKRVYQDGLSPEFSQLKDEYEMILDVCRKLNTKSNYLKSSIEQLRKDLPNLNNYFNYCETSAPRLHPA